MIDLRIGLIGCGAIGTSIAQFVDKQEIPAILSGIMDIESGKVENLLKGLNHQSPEILDNIYDLFGKADLIVEAASACLVPELLQKAIKHKTDCMIMSAGGLLGIEDVIEKAQMAGIKIYCPSGAIAGLDAVAAASIGRIDMVRLTTIKPPQGLNDAPYILENKIDLDALPSKRVIFEGNAFEACKSFPRNINVAAALSLAGVGAERTIVRIVVDPDSKRNIHNVELEGEFGRLTTMTENLPSPFNPKTSYLAALSAIACLKRITSSLTIG